ncbi:glycoside hydrolase family 30 beta sandwich domain-containing protein [Streptomyces sp. TS71-3]|uniref:glycoside hydrolase family 30 protein n=1 Tax=Streptomyces sp. TS71-3 TaxID=2733862 RepID=UPI001BB3E4EF|nr:glycoside hydrolase family 30 beta sandwich domain-containing protein [Streptomyces sp. TS71-3]
MRHPTHRSTPRRLAGRRGVLWTAALTALGAAALYPTLANADPTAGEAVQVYLTTTDDSGGRHVVKGLEKQDPVAFAAGQGKIQVDDSKQYQAFEGGGASFTDTAAWLMNSSGALSQSARDEAMTKLFDPQQGIGLDFIRNPIGGSDLARTGYTFDDMPAGQTDESLSHFSIDHDLADVLPLTKQARQLNPDTKVMGSPWSAPAWMKDNDSLDQGWLQSKYYAAYAQYFVKYLQAYKAGGVPVDYVSVQNEPTCCSGYPSMQWNGSGLAYFTKTDLLPALQQAGLSTKVLALDWNWNRYDEYAAETVGDAAVRGNPNFGGMAWHGYEGDVGEQSTIHDRYPDIGVFDTEHSGGTWVANQQHDDMHNLIDYTRNWGSSWVKWSLAVDQNGGPHNGGCGTCTGLITVHNGDDRSGQVDYTIEYYTMGHLTKFVRPGAHRIDSTADPSVMNVAWQNPDGSKALIAYNDTGSIQTADIGWNGEHFTYDLPAGASATFTWGGSAAGHAPAKAPAGHGAAVAPAAALSPHNKR